MPEAKNLAFSHREIAEILIKQQGLHEGLWGLYLEFGIAGANIQGPNDSVLPAAIVPILKVGIQKFESPNDLTVDASRVNPKSGKIKPTKPRTRRASEKRKSAP